MFSISVTDAKETTVNGKFKDECAYLKKAIEDTINRMSHNDGGNGETGQLAEVLRLNPLITAYKKLCD